MSTAVSTTSGETGIAIMPEEEMDAVMNLQNVLTSSQDALKRSQGQPMVQAFVTARALKLLEAAITPAMLNDFKNLMDSQLGFKTDRKPGTKDRNGKKVDSYPDFVIKRCAINALLNGAKLAGNEFNIIAWQTYLTKEFYQRAVLEFPGLRNFEMVIGPPAPFGEKTAVMDAEAKYEVNGESFHMLCTKGDDGLDRRIVVNRSSVSGPDEMKGKGESKLLRRVHAKLTGMNLDATVESQLNGENADEIIDGNIKSPIHIEPVDEPLPGPDFKHVDEAQEFVLGVSEAVGMTTTQTELRQCIKNSFEELKQTGWSSDAINWCTEQMEEIERSRKLFLKINKGA